MRADEEFVAGKHKIGYVGSQFQSTFGSAPFERTGIMPTFQKLENDMSDERIEATLKPGICTLSDVYALLESVENIYRDGRSNIFYFPSCVVRVRWSSSSGEWSVSAWKRGGSGWGAGFRVFSPATDKPLAISATGDLTLESLDARLRKLEALINPELLK